MINITHSICVITWADKSQRCLNDIVFKTNANYCKSHGYTYIDAQDSVDTLSQGIVRADRDPHYYKLAVLKKYLPHFDYLIWMDSDILICDYSFSFEFIIDRYLHYQNGSMWLPIPVESPESNCTAICIVKNCPESFTILDALLNDQKYMKFYKYGLSREEAALSYYTKIADKHSELIIRAHIPSLWGDLPIIDEHISLTDNAQHFVYYKLDNVLSMKKDNPIFSKYYTHVLTQYKFDIGSYMLNMYKHSYLYDASKFCIHLIGHTNKAKCDAMKVLVNE